MDAQSKSGTQGLQFPGMAVVILALGLILIPDAPFNPTRPSMGGGQKTSSEDVRSRMWQDPFAAVALHREKYHTNDPDVVPKKAFNRGDTDFAYYFDVAPHRICNTSKDGTLNLQKDAHSIDELRCQIQRDTVINSASDVPDVYALAVMVPGGPYAEDAERRLRSRYAVVSGLANSGYVPEDAEHIGYLEFSRECHNAFTHNVGNKVKLCDWPAYVPYEWFAPTTSIVRQDEKKSGRVLVLWLDNDSLSRDKPLNMLGRLRNSITPGRGDKLFGKSATARIRYDILGPTGSGTLEKMYSEIINAKLFVDGGGSEVEGNYQYLDDSTVYSSQATVSTDVIIKNAGRGAENNNQKDAKINWLKTRISRTINTDDELAKTLVCELTFRGIIPFEVTDNNRQNIADTCNGAVFGILDQRKRQHHIALIGEWDTLYSRNLSDSIIKTISEIGNTSTEETKKWVHSFNYLRGLDGVNANVIPGVKGDKNAEEQVRRPVGPNQFDYLRRIADRISYLDDALSHNKEYDCNKRDCVKRGSVKAIGILGSDEYDKLLILQALRKQFPGILFFTTDLDARLLHPAERGWARNLIVASSYGLELHDSLQKGAPPFRDNYQTALYLATMVAMSCGQEECNSDTYLRLRGSLVNNPRLFEVGNNDAVDISYSEGGKIHPDRNAKKTKTIFERKHFIIFILALMAFLLYQAGPGARNIIYVIFGYTILVFILYHFGIKDHVSSGSLNGEPFSLTEGVSVWPANFIRAFAVIIAVTFVFISIGKLKNSTTEIFEKYIEPPHPPEGDANKTPKKEKEKDKEETIHEPGLYGYGALTPGSEERKDIKYSEKIKNALVFLYIDFWWRRIDKGTAVKFEYFWTQHMALCRYSSWIARVAVMFILYGLCAYQLMEYFDLPSIPFRGDISFEVSRKVLLVAVFVYLFLIFLVVDVTRLNDRFVRLLTQCNVVWPKNVIDSCCKDHGIPGYVAEEKIRLDLIVRRAGVVDTLIFYPFFVLFLIIISRSHYFDNWQFPAQLVVFIGFTALIAIGSAIRLRKAAQKVRRNTLNKLHDYYCQALAREALQQNSATPDPELIGLSVRIQLLIDNVKEIDTGPFLPLSRHPIVRAIAMPFGGVGSLYLIDYLTAVS